MLSFVSDDIHMVLLRIVLLDAAADVGDSMGRLHAAGIILPS